MATYLITGTAKGLGLELTKQLSELPESQVSKIFAVTRSPPSTALRDLISRNNGRIVNVVASVDDTKSVEKAAQEVKGQLGYKGLDVLINNAAIQQHSPNNKMEDFSAADFSRILEINLVGPHRVITAFLPLLRTGTQKKIINISSTMGSIAWADAMNIAQGSAYKVSKAGFHMLNKQFSLDLADEGFTCLLVSPGWLKTDLGTDYGDFTVDVGAAEIKRIVLASTPAQNGKFLNIHVPGHENSPGRYDGKEIEW